MLAFPVAYALCYVSGLVVATLLTGRLVFRARLTGRRAVAFVGVYVSVFAVGLGVSRLVDSAADPGPTVVALSVLAVTTPLNFLGGRLVFA